MMMKNRRKNIYRLTSVTLITAILGVTMAGSAYAGPPEISTDEALYVNLDYYGTQVDSSVVKGVSLNGLRSFTDYGTYTDVTNMSNYAQPVVNEDGVTWELPQDVKERFYYECQLNNEEVTLPWNFDVSYKLNGMSKKAEDLLHADGLVEMDIKCTPNQSARDYYRNNMILQVATMVNMEDVNSVEAPGSQTQSIGTYKVVLFAAVPGQEKTFHIEISTHDFETMGIIMMMVPGTLDQINDVADIRDAKDTFGDSTDELLDGMNEILDTLHSVTAGMAAAQSGLEKLQAPKENFDASKDEITQNADASIDSLEAVNAKISLLSPDINANKQALDEVNGRVNGLVETLRDSGDDFSRLSLSLKDLKYALGDLQSGLSGFDGSLIKEQLNKVEKQLDEIEKVLNQILSKTSGDVDEADLEQQQVILQALMEEIYGVLDDLEEVAGTDAVKQLRAQLDQIANSGLEEGAAAGLSQAAAVLSKIISSLQNLVSRLRHTISTIDLEGNLGNGKSIANELSSIMDSIETTIGDIETLNTTKNDSKAAFDVMLTDTAESVEAVNSGTSQLISLFRTIQTTARNNRNAVEDGTKETLDGLIDILEKAAKTSESTDKVQAANESIRSSVKGELDKIGDDSNLLEMNADEAMLSFTSDKNPTPSSIQIVLRTQEISGEEMNDNAVDIEPVAEDLGVWQRIVNVFKKIWNAVTGFIVKD